MVDVSILANDPYPAIALIVGGLLSVIVALLGKRDDSHMDELATYLGFLVGIVTGVMAFFVAIEETGNWFTLTMMILLAVMLFLKPMKDIPWAAIAGLIAGGVVAYIVSIYMEGEFLGIEERTFLVVIFFIVAFIVHLLFHFVEDMLKIARMILDWRPVMVVVGLVALAEGVMLLLDTSLITLF